MISIGNSLPSVIIPLNFSIQVGDSIAVFVNIADAANMDVNLTLFIGTNMVI